MRLFLLNPLFIPVCYLFLTKCEKNVKLLVHARTIAFIKPNSRASLTSCALRRIIR